MRTSDFDYDLPEEFIAQTPAEPRDSSKLMVLYRDSGEIEHAVFRDIGRFLNPGDILVLNETRVIPARLYARKLPGGGRVELLLLRREDPQTWEVLVGGQGMNVGRRFQVETLHGEPGLLDGEVTGILDGARRKVRFTAPLEAFLPLAGHVPLPPYIHTPLEDPERYQTVYAQQSGSSAAPTAGLHFTQELLEQLRAGGIGVATVLLHVGLDTFAPVTEDNPREHAIHTEWCQVTPEAAEAINRARQAGRRVIAVGTTSVRTLETAAGRSMKAGDPDSSEIARLASPFSGPTDLYILPGYRFRLVDAMVTNFHLPRSTLIMLVSAFAGRDRILAAYETAKSSAYRFYSFGDAMLIL